MTSKIHDIQYDNLKRILQEKIRDIDISDIHRLTIKFNQDTRYIPPEYHEEYNKKILETIIKRYHKLKNDKKSYPGKCSKKEVKVCQLLENQSDAVETLLNITAIYAIVFLKEPVHPNNTKLPGNLNIYKEDNIYYCPIKKYQINNKKALCQYCIATSPKINGDNNG